MRSYSIIISNRLRSYSATVTNRLCANSWRFSGEFVVMSHLLRIDGELIAQQFHGDRALLRDNRSTIAKRSQYDFA
jgi:hypothetical protein